MQASFVDHVHVLGCSISVVMKKRIVRSLLVYEPNVSAML